MSELAKLLSYSQTKREFMDRPSISAVASAYGETLPTVQNFTRLYEYRMELRLGANIVVRDTYELENKIQNVKRYIIEHVFGEFKMPLLEAQHCLHNHDIKGAHKVLESILKQMFEDGI